ncbi:MAG: restriction endonuclease subunit S [Elusimicrobia bacterium]|nr:restriction endonuclease subunit S [Elusimicrobiota bacterium]MBU2613978.1 restriction endonuclease subunit S [Elusimicrobiota bacterium]
MSQSILNVPFEDIYRTTSGGTPSRSHQEYYAGNIPWLKSGELEDNIIFDTQEKITQKAIDNSSAKLFPKGTLLIALYGATIGKLGILGINATTNQAICAIFENNLIVSKYTYYYLFFKRQKFISIGFGGAQPNISQDIVRKQLFPLIAFEEQKQIVSTIDQLFSDLDNAVENLKKVREQLKIYRQSVLKYAFEGKLLSIEQPLTKRLGDLTELITKGASPRWQGIKYVSDASQVLFITSENVQVYNLDISEPKYVEVKINDKQKRSILKKGDVLLNIVGASIGRSTVYNENIIANINQAVALIRCKVELNNQYLTYFLNSGMAWHFYDSKKVDVARANLSLTDVANIPIPFYETKIQNEIVSEIEKRFSICDKLETTIDENIQKSGVLRQSILKQAFEGKLTEHWRREHQDLITGENSAEALLAKIKAEKETLKKQKGK